MKDDEVLKEIYAKVERYIVPLFSNDPSNMTGLSKEENRVLALQQINRLNQRIGQVARSSKENYAELKPLQVYVNSLTMGVKNDNSPQIKAALAFVRSYIWE